MQTPMSTGCGHFFCRFCITELLNSKYRAPCPLCKKSFTRRYLLLATYFS
ncbi:Breast cancer type 1 susceptibility protein-like protein, partial [Stegodyphus mimosarum]